MAYIFHATASFGAREEDARAFAARFDFSPVQVEGRAVYFQVAVAHETTGWECHIIPLEAQEPGAYLNGHGGASDDEEQAILDAVSRILYQRLQLDDARYDFAMVGVEVGGWRDAEDLTGELSPNGAFRNFTWKSGLVLSNAVYHAAAEPPGFVPFADGRVWSPFERAD